MGTCKQSLSLRSGTFFDKSRMSLKQWLILFYWWAREYPVTDAAEEAEVEKKTASDTGLPILQGHLQLATPSPRLPSPARRTRSDSSD